MSVIEYTSRSKRVRATRKQCIALGCTSLAAERDGIHGRLPQYCRAHGPVRYHKSKPNRRETIIVDEAIEYVTIDEWKARYGLPGSGGSLDATHRAIGFSQRYELFEPDYCEDVEEAA